MGIYLGLWGHLQSADIFYVHAVFCFHSEKKKKNKNTPKVEVINQIVSQLGVSPFLCV